MQFVLGMPFDQALQRLGSKSTIGAKLKSSEWADLPAALRERAFFSSQVENLRALQTLRNPLTDFLTSARETLPSGETALKTGSRAQFIDQMQAALQKLGIERTDGRITDITSEGRLGLIFDTNTRAANDYGFWKQGQDANVLDEFPAQRFIRVQEVKEPRDAHIQFEDQVFLKNDPIWARINEDFGVPWGPWGWGCGHDVEDVDRAEAEALGLIAPGQRLAPDEKHFNENLSASTRGIDPDLLAKLLREFGDRISVIGDALVWNTGSNPT